jgi:glutamine amidotransferase
MFMHNGGIGCFRQIKRRLAMSLGEKWFGVVGGSTDSEWAFALFLDCLDKAGVSPDKEVSPDMGFGHSVVRKAILQTVKRINSFIAEAVAEGGVGEEDSRSLLNFAVTDGVSVVCTRYISSRTDEAASLFFSSGTSWKGVDVEHGGEEGDYVMERRDKGSDIVLVASEPLTFERGMFFLLSLPTFSLLPYLLTRQKIIGSLFLQTVP